MAKKLAKPPKRTPAALNIDSVANTAAISIKHDQNVSATPLTAHTSDSPANKSSGSPPASLINTPSLVSTCVAFRDFIQLADHQSIKIFFDVAATSPQGENLKPLWDRAFKEGLRVGHQLYVETVGKLNEAHKTGYEEGYSTGYNEGRRDEDIDWRIEGHGGWCTPLQCHQESGIQTDGFESPQAPEPPSFETNTQTTPPAPTNDAGTQYEPPPVIFEATSSDEPQLVTAASPAPTLIAYEKITTPGTILSTTITIDTPIASTPVDFISNTPKFVGSPPQTTKSISPNPVFAPLAPQKILNTSPHDMSFPILQFLAKTNGKNLDWSSEPCDFHSRPPRPHSPPPSIVNFGARDFSVLRSGSNPWRSICQQKGRQRRYTNRQSRPQNFSHHFCPMYNHSLHCHHCLPPTASVFPTNVSSLDWDHDPWLSNLSHALKALGWVRQ